MAGVVLPFQMPVAVDDSVRSPFASSWSLRPAYCLAFCRRLPLHGSRRSRALHAGGRGVVAGTLRGTHGPRARHRADGAGGRAARRRGALRPQLWQTAPHRFRFPDRIAASLSGFACSAIITARPRRSRTFYRTLGHDFAALPGVKRFGYMSPTVAPYDGLDDTAPLQRAAISARADGTLAVQAALHDERHARYPRHSVAHRTFVWPAGSARQSRRRSGQRNSGPPDLA